MIALVHNKVSLAVHELRGGEGRALLLLHGLGERSPDEVPAYAAAWPGPIAALDFTGHGDSTLPAGGGYTAEILMADADIAVEHFGQVTLLGRTAPPRYRRDSSSALAINSRSTGRLRRSCAVSRAIIRWTHSRSWAELNRSGMRTTTRAPSR